MTGLFELVSIAIAIACFTNNLIYPMLKLSKTFFIAAVQAQESFSNEFAVNVYLLSTGVFFAQWRVNEFWGATGPRYNSDNATIPIRIVKGPWNLAVCIFIIKNKSPFTDSSSVAFPSSVSLEYTEEEGRRLRDGVGDMLTTLEEEHSHCQSTTPPEADSCCQNPRNLAIVGGVALMVKAIGSLALAIYMLHLREHSAWVEVVLSSFTLVVITPILFWGIHFEKRRYLTAWLLWNLAVITINICGFVVLVHKSIPIHTSVIIGVFANVTWILLASRPVYVFRKVLKALDPSVESEPHF
ncbi:uncharacterized protein LOC119586441 [Penaeus monodon]|uniref:uncharacterized protein LOC119586441 n=1 Tax=Penaeus monodon TaxID=6687 RepID=UPI0018A7AEF6|nr:uncharacterized protein LOC119586441 [Penaeus monodon]